VIRSRSAVAVRVPRKTFPTIEHIVGILDRISLKAETLPSAETLFTEEFGPFDVTGRH